MKTILIVTICLASSFAARTNFGRQYPRFQRQQDFSGYNYEKPSIPFNYEPVQTTPKALEKNPAPLPEVQETTDTIESSTLPALPEPNILEEPQDDNEEVPFNPNQFPGINFFPISIGGFGRSGLGEPVGTIAIANSFSTGRGGVSNSKATAFGDARSFRNRDRGTEDRSKSLFN